MIRSLDHVAVPMEAVDAMLTFYRKLGCDVGGFVCKLKKFCVEFKQHQGQGERKFDAERFVFHSAAALNVQGLINAAS